MYGINFHPNQPPKNTRCCLIDGCISGYKNLGIAISCFHTSTKLRGLVDYFFPILVVFFLRQASEPLPPPHAEIQLCMILASSWISGRIFPNPYVFFRHCFRWWAIKGGVTPTTVDPARECTNSTNRSRNFHIWPNPTRTNEPIGNYYPLSLRYFLGGISGETMDACRFASMIEALISCLVSASPVNIITCHLALGTGNFP